MDLISYFYITHECITVMKQPFNGWLLLETLLSLAVVGIVIGIALPSYQLQKEQDQTQHVKQQLTQALYQARSLAIINGEKISVCGSSNGTHCDNKWQNGILLKSKKQILQYFQIKQNPGKLVWRGFPINQCPEFLPNGLTNQQNGHFYYYHNKNPLFILILSKAGKIKLSEY